MYDYADTLTETTVAQLAEGDQLPLLAEDREPFTFASSAELATEIGVAVTDYVSEMYTDVGDWRVIETADGAVFTLPPDSPIVARKALRTAGR